MSIGSAVLEREPEAADDRVDRLLEVEPGLLCDLLGRASAAEERPGDEIERHDLRSGHHCGRSPVCGRLLPVVTFRIPLAREPGG